MAFRPTFILRSSSVDQLARVIFVLGGPGCGKGTYCNTLVERNGFVHLSAGDLLREEQATDSKDSDLIKTHIKEGKIVPVEITCSLLHKAMIKKGMEKKFLIDGFPRNLNNMNGWNKQMHAYTILKQVLFFETTEETMLKRIMKRAKTSGRVDDNIEAAQKRFKTFKEETMPVIDIYTAQNLVLKIDGNREIEEVYADVVKGLVI